MTAASYGTSRAVTHMGTWNQATTSVSHAAKPIVRSSKGEKISLVNMTTERPVRTTGQKPPNVVSQTTPVQRKAWAAPRPSAHGINPNTTARDLASCRHNQAIILDLPDDATADGRACMPRMLIAATIIPSIGRGENHPGLLRPDDGGPPPRSERRPRTCQ